MLRRLPKSTRTSTLFPHTSLFRADRIGLLPFEPRRARLQQAFAGAEADRAEILLVDERAHRIGTADGAQQAVVRRIVALGDRGFDEVANAHRHRALGAKIGRASWRERVGQYG